MTELRERVATLITDILKPAGSPVRLRRSCWSLHALLAEMAGHSATLNSRPGTRLSGGIALSPVAAGRSIWDLARTAAFMQGIKAAALDLLECRSRSGPLEIVYAGCGPFATLALPVILEMSPSDARWTLLDCHNESLDSAARVIRALGLTDHTVKFEKADAARYEHGRAIDLVISETMQSGLKKEPLVSIVQNLAPQMSEHGIFIPQKVTVEACIADPAPDFVEVPVYEFRHIGPVFELEARGVRQNGLPDLSSGILEIPECTGSPDLVLFTGVEVYGEIGIGANDSGLTLPLRIAVQGGAKGGDRIVFTYIMGENPHFECRKV